MPNMLVQAVIDQGSVAVEVPAGSDPVSLLAPAPGAVYTGFKAFDGGRFLALDYHLTRLAQSARQAGHLTRPTHSELRRALAAACDRWGPTEARVLIELLRQPLPALHPTACAFVMLWPTRPPDPVMARDGVRAVLAAPNTQRDDPTTKRSDWRQERAALMTDPSAYEHLLVSPTGHVLEGFTSNFYGVIGETVYTAGDGILLGITRRLLLDVFVAVGLTVVEQPLPAGAIHTLDEAGMSSSSRGLVPITKIGDEVIGTGCPGPILANAAAEYDRRLRLELAPAWP